MAALEMSLKHEEKKLSNCMDSEALEQTFQADCRFIFSWQGRHLLSLWMLPWDKSAQPLKFPSAL